MIDARLERFKNVTINEMINESGWIKEIDDLECNFDNKTAMLVAAIECPEEYLDLFKALTDLIAYLIQRNFKKHKVTVAAFGSSAAQLALKECDLDIFVTLDPTLVFDRKWFLILKRIFRKYQTGLFNSMIYIDAKVPILKCFLDIGIQCDLSTNNELALRNTELIKFFVSLNKRFRSFFLLIKLWTKRRSNACFKGYVVALLTIFFLQQKKLLPSVISLQNHPKSPEPLIINGWKCSFLNDPSCYESIVNQELVILDLLKEFFNFYAQFEFGFYVISPNSGEKVLKPFKNCYKSAKEELEPQKEFYITIQDVFELDFCPSAHVVRTATLDFQNDCQHACDIWEKGDFSFSSLFVKSNKKKRKRLSSEICLIVGNTYLEAASEEEMRNKWVVKMLAAVEEILLHVAKFEIISKEDGCFRLRAEQTFIFNKKLRAKARLEVEETPPKETEKSWPNLTAALQVHAAITDAILTKETIPPPSPIEFYIKYTLNTHPTKLRFNVVPIKGRERMPDLIGFINCFGHWISQI